jgi:serine O-acetyltransferase
VQTVFAKDPAARGLLEVLTCYPGLHAIWLYRIAHALWRGKLRFFARLLSHIARWLTGIEIHPGATIGRRVFIDHGMGVVVGETTEIGDDVLIYKGVVLGGVSQEKKKRHPTVCRGVILGSNATILGPIEIGAGAKIGSGAVVVKPVPPCTTVVGVPGRVVRVHNEACPLTPDLRHNQMPDDVSKRFAEMEARIAALEARLAAPEATEVGERAGNNGKDG